MNTYPINLADPDLNAVQVAILNAIPTRYAGDVLAPLINDQTLDVTGVWSDDLPHIAEALRAAADTNHDLVVGDTLLRAADYVDTQAEARFGERLAALV